MSASLNVSEWDSFVAGFRQKQPGNSTSTSGAHILQTSAWATLKCNFGWSATRIVARQQGCTIAGAQILFRPLPLGLGNIAYLPKGPLVDWSDIEQCKYIMSLCDEVCRAHRALFLIVEPDLANNEFANNVLNTLGLTPGTQTVQPRRTITISLKTDQTDILAKMKQKTRYNIRLAERSGVKVRIATS
ncbi:MAG TPA: peptidoglycan bridge formation glycyltransferase FemA/FemB family protein, partial [Anaerolineales bacterium]|nr:peptidoglycan bridge formation glycyltransferase FemA/FemB family protein [Anaerolineales bacterium]